MPTKAKRTLITTESREMWIVRRGERKGRRGFCPRCEAEVEMVVPEVAARLSDVSARAVYGLIEDGSLHFAETPDRALLVCLNSLNSRANR